MTRHAELKLLQELSYVLYTLDDDNYNGVDMCDNDDGGHYLVRMNGQRVGFQRVRIKYAHLGAMF